MEGIQTSEGDHSNSYPGSPTGKDNLESSQNQPHPPEKLGQDCALFGPWMIAKKRQRTRPKAKNTDNLTKEQTINQQPPMGSRFQILVTPQEPIEEVGTSLNSPGQAKANPKIPAPRVRNPLGGKNPQNGAKINPSKHALKQNAAKKEKPLVSAPMNNQQHPQTEASTETSPPRKSEHEDHEMVFQMMRQIQSQMHNEGSLFLPGTKIFGPGQEELEFLKARTSSEHDPGPTAPHKAEPPLDCVMTPVDASEHLPMNADKAPTPPS
ncbi:hypothetical protein SESBI_09913 [Sesbania bispinosa]|nr:hypothetical protein SESBI_09913 [Sesbania bispinosa]